ncbi:MAG: TlpA family protein disulfide reductase [Acidobacteriota bacterium]|nr:MAG: TlpA family protein disulfide reductase [Acidobacteriota bacterium]
MRIARFAASAAIAAFAVLFFAVDAAAQRSAAPPKAVPVAVDGPKITQVDIDGLRGLLKPNGKPLLINFWATWCEPCREEFPDLIKIDDEFRGKIDFITISLDDVDDMTTVVPRFLGEMKATMPAYLLHTADPDAAIKLVSEKWTGVLPLTILYNADGSVSYLRMGKVRYIPLAEEVKKALAAGAK